MDDETPVTVDGQASAEARQNGDAPESEQAPQNSDELLSHDRQELSERVSHLEKRVREQEDEIACLKGALADVMRRIGQVESTKATNSLLPSKPLPKSPRRAPSGQERPKSMISEGFGHPPSTPRPTPRGASASSVGKKWGSMSNSIDEANGHRSPKHTSSQLTHAKKGVTWNPDSQALKMYLGGRPVMLYASSDVTELPGKKENELPDKKLTLEWVYGYRGRDARSNLHLLPTGELLYFIAGVVVLFDPVEGTQRHYMEHTDDIKCIAVHPDKVKIASGQVAGHDKKQGKPHVRIWNSVTLATLHVFGEGVFERGVCCVNFSKFDGGKLLCAVDESNDHRLSVWDCSKSGDPTKICDTKAHGDPVTQCEFNPSEENSIVMCGKNLIAFWTLKGKTLNKKMGIFSSPEKKKNKDDEKQKQPEKPGVVICFAFAPNGDVITGDSNGTILVWGNGSNHFKGHEINAHQEAIFSLCVVEQEDEEPILVSGAKDGKLAIWKIATTEEEAHLDRVKELELPEHCGSVRTICPGKSSDVFIGTIRNGILKGNLDKEDNFEEIVMGHRGEVWGLDTMPKQQQFLTCGYDKTIYMWDSMSHQNLWSKEISYSAHSCDIHPNEEVAVVGTQSSNVLVLDMKTHETITVIKVGAEQVECAAYSPDGSQVAFGNRDNCIYVYNVSDNGRKYSKLGKCSGHSSYITHVDWDTEGNIIRSNSGTHDCLYWEAKNCKQEPNKDDFKNLEWATNNCTLSFNTWRIWPEGADGTDVNGCSVSHDGSLIASADDFGFVNLFEYPCIRPTAKSHSYQGHSSHVTRAKFLCDDSYVITTGGNDTSIFQWKVE